MNLSFRAKSAFAATLLTSLLAPAVSHAENGDFYLRVFGGASALSSSDLTGAFTGNIGFDTGQVFGGAVGYDFASNPLRAELEYAYRTGDADGAAGITGDLASTTVALNGYYDFAAIGGGRITPYVGVGLAYVTEVDFDVTTGGASQEFSDSGGVGYQIMVGATYPISDRWSVNGELRYFDAGSQTLSGPGGAFDVDYQSVDLIVGTSFKF